MQSEEEGICASALRRLVRILAHLGRHSQVTAECAKKAVKMKNCETTGDWGPEDDFFSLGMDNVGQKVELPIMTE